MKFKWTNDVPIANEKIVPDKCIKEKDVYLDNNANHPMLPEVIDIVCEEMKQVGNASSSHYFGQLAMSKVKEAHIKVASLLNVEPGNIIFTSGGSESNNMFMKGLIFKKTSINSKNRILFSKFEHKSISTIMSKFVFPQISYAYAPSFTSLLDEVKESRDIIGFSHIYAQNETGVVYNQLLHLFEDIKKINPSILLHSDMSQVIGKTKMPELDAFDAVTFSSHKIGGPLGCGILYLKNPSSISPLIHGGTQEFQLRAGTYNVPGIVGMAKAIEMSINLDFTEMVNLRNYMIDQIFKMHNSKLISNTDKLLANTAAMILEGVNAKSLVENLSKFGVYISRGSACNSVNASPSDIYLAAGFTEREANSTIRISLNRWTTKEDIDYFLSKLRYCLNRL